MKLAVLAGAGADGAAALAERIAALSAAPCPLLDATLPPQVPVELSAAGIHWGGVAVHRLEALFVCGIDFEEPQVPREVASAEWGVWQIDYLVDQQRASFVSSVLREAARRGVRVVNRWEALHAGFSRPALLTALARAGCKVPPWLCSNDMEAVKRFCAGQEAVAWRPAAGRARWQLFLDKQREALVDPKKPPVLIARHPDRELVRAFVCAGEVLLAFECAPPRIDGFEHMEEVRACDPGPAAAALERIPALLGAEWAQVSYVPNGDSPIVYDVDVDPRYGWLPAAWRDYLEERLARKLLGLPAPTPAELPLPAPAERDSLFVRRMLVSLHEMEATKYPKSGEAR